jgi:DtxR family Mn-dependent transcriptional regulator
MAQDKIEKYVESIYDVQARDGSAKTTAIAKCLKVSPASVTEIFRTLSDKGLIDYEPYYGAILTPEGRKLAESIKRKHRLLEVFLTDILKIRRENVHDEACRMEHTLSDEAENALCRMLDGPARCPHGSPIGPCNKEVGSCAECIGEGVSAAGDAHREGPIVPITVLAPGQKGTIAFIRGDCRVVQRLSDLGLTLGTKVAITRKTPLDGPVEVSVRRTKLAIDHEIAESIFVRPPEGAEA